MQQSGPKMRWLLVIDDDEDLLEIFQALFSSIPGLQVLLANTGPKGVKVAQEHPVDAILLDVIMPGLSGLEVFQHLQTHPNTALIPVIFMTAKRSPLEQERLLQLGAQAVVFKVCKAPQLVSQVVEILNRIYHDTATE